MYPILFQPCTFSRTVLNYVFEPLGCDSSQLNVILGESLINFRAGFECVSNARFRSFIFSKKQHKQHTFLTVLIYTHSFQTRETDVMTWSQTNSTELAKSGYVGNLHVLRAHAKATVS